MAIEHGLMTTQWSNELESAAHVHKIFFYKQPFFLQNESFNDALGPWVFLCLFQNKLELW